MRPALPCIWVICYRASNGRPRNPSITLANTSLEHGLLLFEAKQSTAYATKKELAHTCSVLVPTRSTVAMWGLPSPGAIRGFVRGGSG
jgi:hypothetical protein